jgi:hypothetical protein
MNEAFDAFVNFYSDLKTFYEKMNKNAQKKWLLLKPKFKHFLFIFSVDLYENRILYTKFC